MSKKLLVTIIAILGVMLLIAMLSAAGRQTAEDSAEDSEITAGTEMLVVPSEMPEKISFEIPAGFAPTASKYYEKYYVLNDASVIVTGDKLPDYNQTVDSYTEGVKQQYEQTADSFRLLSEETIALSGLTGKLLEFTYDIVGQDATQAMECCTAIFVKNGEVYLITCKSRQETYAGYRNSFRKMLESVVIADESDTSTAPADVPANTEPTAAPFPAETAAPAE